MKNTHYHVGPLKGCHCMCHTYEVGRCEFCYPHDERSQDPLKVWLKKHNYKLVGSKVVKKMNTFKEQLKKTLLEIYNIGYMEGLRNQNKNLNISAFNDIVCSLVEKEVIGEHQDAMNINTMNEGIPDEEIIAQNELREHQRQIVQGKEKI